MPMKHHGESPQGKKGKKETKAKHKADERELKEMRAKHTDRKPGKNDPRITGK